ncbi:hypothetical protein [Leifsonia sp. P73]|uniref:hypothetical protein n=1 Tax=Leifsonia sp. P73 TaxID=3423959 RepID=UPI003DA30AE1
MSFRRSRAVVPVLEVLPEAASTNDVLQARAGDLPDLAVVVTDNQTGGRGRLGRVWVSPPARPWPSRCCCARRASPRRRSAGSRCSPGSR